MQEEYNNMPLPNEVKEKLELQDQVSDAVKQLKNKGLVKFGFNNEIMVPKSLQEQMAFLQEVHDEERLALTTSIANRQLQMNGNDVER
jgi:hypothetical protein